MNCRPVPQPAEFPLPGAQQGATLTLRPLLCGTLAMPPNWFERKSGLLQTLKAFGVGVRHSDLSPIPIPAYLLEHPRARHVLVDTGMDRSIASGTVRERLRNLGPVGMAMSRHPHMQPEQTASAQLRTLGIDPREIELLIMTHLHFDHASALRDFPKAKVLVDAREWKAAWARDSLLHGYSHAQIDPRPSYLTIDFNAPYVKPSGPFERTIDVFGDGSLTLASTPGHTAGHISLILRGGDGAGDGEGQGETLLTADAAYTLATIHSGKRPWLTHNRGAFEHSLSQIQTYARAHSRATIVPGHDPGAWRELPSP